MTQKNQILVVNFEEGELNLFHEVKDAQAYLNQITTGYGVSEENIAVFEVVRQLELDVEIRISIHKEEE